MAETPNVGLTKPTLSTNPNRPDVWGAALNDNADKIDANFGAVLARLAALEAGGGGDIGPSHGHVIVYNGVELPARSRLRIVGAAVVTDDAANDTTIVTIDGGTPAAPSGAITFRGAPLTFRGAPIVRG